MDPQREVSKNEHDQSILSGMPVIKTLYGLSIDEDDYLDIALDSLRDIKHFGLTEYIAYLEVRSGGKVTLPCNLTYIDAVTTAKMGEKVFHNRMKYDTQPLLGTDDYLTHVKIMDSIGYGGTYGAPNFGYDYNSSIYRGGRGYRYDPINLADGRGDGYLSYYLISCKELKVDECYEGQTIAIAFSGISSDCEGFPKITRKQANSIAASCAKVVNMKKAMRGDKNAMSFMDYFVNEASRLKQAASIPENIEDNEIDALLDAQTTFNRKSYGRPTKYSR